MLDVISWGAKFLSTLPARGATGQTMTMQDACRISIHAPREGSDSLPAGDCRMTTISIHAPREGSDWTLVSTSPRYGISIHAPREGSDRTPLTFTGPWR